MTGMRLTGYGMPKRGVVYRKIGFKWVFDSILLGLWVFSYRLLLRVFALIQGAES
jgi:hypothetical protein